MASFTPTTHKAVVSQGLNPSSDVSADFRDVFAKLFGDMGVKSITAGNIAPANLDSLWYHTDIKTLKRYNAVAAAWQALTPNQYAMHLIRRAVLGSVTEIALETGDLFLFWDVSLGEVKIISRDALMNALGATRTITTTEGVQGGGTLAINRTLKLDVNGLTAKTEPVSADLVAIYSVADAAHRKSTVDQIAASLARSDYLHSEIWFKGLL